MKTPARFDGPFDEIARLFADRGDAAYHGEAVSQTEHALQAAYLAEREGAPHSLVVSALLHDLGHLLDDDAEGLADLGIDGGHEALGAAWLATRFGPDVVEPARRHVDAKRFLCAVDPEYLRRLSPASIRSLELQGGAMTDEEAARFEADPHREAAVRLRRWDDAAKIPGLAVPGVDHYRIKIEATARLVMKS